MKLTFDKVETVDYEIPKGCRKPRYVDHEYKMDFNIKEVSRESVTPVFIVKSYQNEDREIISYRGHNYIQAQDRDPNYDKLTDEEQRTHHLFTNLSMDSRGERWLRWRIGTLRNSYDEVVKYMTEQSGYMLIVDGKIYRRCGEPYYSPITFGLGNNHGGTSYRILFTDIASRKKKIYGLSPVSLEQAREATVNVALDRGDTKYVNHINTCSEQIIVLDSSAIKKTYYYE